MLKELVKLRAKDLRDRGRGFKELGDCVEEFLRGRLLLLLLLLWGLEGCEFLDTGFGKG